MPLIARLPGLLLFFGLLVPATSMAQSTTASSSKTQTGSRWNQLSARDQAALAPLAERWGEISDVQRSKWLTIAKGFDQLPTSEQQVMQARMKEWVALSPIQRNQARLNFNNLQGVSKDEKKIRWDEYQALSDEQKRKLSAGVLSPAKTAAPSPKSTASERLVQPTVRSVPAAALPPRAPIDKNTLLPLPPTSPDGPSAIEAAREGSAS